MRLNVSGVCIWINSPALDIMSASRHTHSQITYRCNCQYDWQGHLYRRCYSNCLYLYLWLDEGRQFERIQLSMNQNPKPQGETTLTLCLLSTTTQMCTDDELRTKEQSPKMFVRLWSMYTALHRFGCCVLLLLVRQQIVCKRQIHKSKCWEVFDTMLFVFQPFNWSQKRTQSQRKP